MTDNNNHQQRLFTYGTLQNPSVQKLLVGREIPMTADALPGFIKKNVLLGDGVYPILMPDPDGGGLIEGMVLEVTPEELARFDIYETSAYKRVEVTLHSGALAWVYVENQ